MANRTNTSAPYYSYEYYLDYLDLMPVDEKKLSANKHSIAIAFWVSLAAFLVFLFLILLYMSWSGSPQTSCEWTHRVSGKAPTSRSPWSTSSSLLFLDRGTPPRSPQHVPGVLASTSRSTSGGNPSTPGPPRGTLQPPPSSVEEPDAGASRPVQQLQRERPSTSAPPGLPCSPLGTGPRWGPTGHQLTSATRPVSLPCRQNLSMGEPTPHTHVPSESLFM
ncbi:melanocortin-2 receptor accessory protein isoform X1 [Ovis aries]|uniref:Uncharacterized protein n=1 Tax=Ovis aries TaxID=9940 RepID=A0AC11ELF5_SHEEP|nr:melanocortin-2 receptor accessory protein isoform X1 [Ovis aries]